MKFPLGAMTVGDILDRGLKLLLARFSTILTINLIVQLPLLAYQLVFTPVVFSGDVENMLPLLVGGGLVALIIQIILSYIAMAAVLHVIAQEYIDNRVGVGKAFSVGLARFGPLLGTALLAGLLYFIGFLACFVPGLFMLVWYAFFAQVVVLEGKGGIRALNRSKDLGSGFGGRIFGIILLLVLINVGVGMAAGLLAYVLPWQEVIPRGPGEFPIQKIGNFQNFVINTVFTWFVTILASSYQVVCITLLYFDLRNRKEGFDLEMAARGSDPVGRPEGTEPAL